MASLPPLLVVGVLLMSGAGAQIAWTKTLTAPYSGSGSPYLGVGTFGYTSTRPSVNNTVSPYFDYTSGTGGFNFTGFATSSILPPGGGSSGRPGQLAGGYAVINAVVPIGILVPFHNQSGTRTLTSVNITISYQYSGNESVASGHCPWVKTTKKVNYCDVGLWEQISLYPQQMAKPNGKQGISPVCTQGCGAISGSSIGLWNYSTNSSKGLNVVAGSTSRGNASFAGSGMISLVYSPSPPVLTSGKWVVHFELFSYMQLDMACKMGAGGLTGASEFGTLASSFSVVSIVEK